MSKIYLVNRFFSVRIHKCPWDSLTHFSQRVVLLSSSIVDYSGSGPLGVDLLSIAGLTEVARPKLVGSSWLQMCVEGHTFSSFGSGSLECLARLLRTFKCCSIGECQENG